MSSTALQLRPARLQPTTVPPGPDRPARPELRLLEGGRAPAAVAQQAIYRRRRLGVAVVAAVLLATLLLAAPAVARIAGGTPSPAAGDPSPTSAVAPRAAGVAALPPAPGPSVIVQAGDTLWSIAAAVAPEVDVRVTVDRLVALNGAAPIVPGQELEVPAG